MWPRLLAPAEQKRRLGIEFIVAGSAPRTGSFQQKPREGFLTGSGSPDAPALEQALFARRGRREGAEIRFLCPAHDDSHPSARYSPEKKTWYCDVCRAGGGQRHLARALGLSGAEPAHSHADSEIVAVYSYCDSGGNLLYQVVRRRPKVFVCRRPDGAGGWLWNLEGVEHVLYRLPEILSAARSGRQVFVVEGEKDADALVALGLEATTCSGGAGRWRPRYSQALRGASVIVVPDNDEPGRRHAEEIAHSAAPVAAELRVLRLPDLPPKGDVSDWLGAGAAAGKSSEDLREELLELASAAPRWAGQTTGSLTTPLLSSTFAVADPESPRRLSEVLPVKVEFLWYPYLPIRKLTLLDGDPGQGKSWITLAIAASGSVGAGLPRTPSFEPFRTLLLAEDGVADTVRPRLDALGADCSMIFAHDEPFSLANPDGLLILEQLIERCRPRLVVIDTLSDYLGMETDVHRGNEVSSVLRPVVRLAGKHGCALLALRHITKARHGKPLYAGQGNIAFGGIARSVLLAGSEAVEPRRHALIHVKANLGPLGPASGYTVRHGRFAWTGDTALTAADLLASELQGSANAAEDEARAFLREALAKGELPARRVVEEALEAGISERTLKRARHRESVRSRRQGFGTGSSWLWSLPDPDRRGPGSEEGQAQTWPSSTASPEIDGERNPPTACDRSKPNREAEGSSQ